MAWPSADLFGASLLMASFFCAGVLTLCSAIVYLRSQLAASISQYFVISLPAGLTFLQHTGARYPLMDYLKSHPDWHAVYQDAAGYLFVRRASGAR